MTTKAAAMFIKKATGPRTAHMPDGSVLTFTDLPPPDTRWVASRKAAVVCAVTHGLITRDAALRRWHLTGEELEAWTTSHARYGLKALKVTHLQKYRQPQVDL